MTLIIAVGLLLGVVGAASLLLLVVSYPLRGRKREIQPGGYRWMLRAQKKDGRRKIDPAGRNDSPAVAHQKQKRPFPVLQPKAKPGKVIAPSSGNSKLIG